MTTVMTSPGDIALLLRLLDGEVPDVDLHLGPVVVTVAYRGHRFPLYRITAKRFRSLHPVQRRDGAEASVTVSAWAGPVTVRINADTVGAAAAEHVAIMLDVAAGLAALWEARR